MAGEGNRLVVIIAQAGVGARRKNDVYATQQGSQSDFVADELQVSHQDHLIHPLDDQIVDHRLQLASQQRHVIVFGPIPNETFHFHPAGGADLLQKLRGGAHKADLFAALDHDCRGNNSSLQRRGLLQPWRSRCVGESRSQIDVTTEIKIG